jgi:hypothetical protein
MLSIVQSPPLVSLIGNPIRFTFETDNAIESAATQTRLNIYFTERAGPDSLLHFLWGSVDILFTFVATPDGSGLQLPDSTNAGTLASWVTMVAAAMRNNYYISRDWTIVTNDVAILMYGTEDNISNPSVNPFWTGQGNIPSTSSVNGKLASKRLFYKLGIRLETWDGTAWNTIGEDILPVDTNSQATFDIHELFADYIYPEFKFPEASDTLAILRPNSSTQYRIQYFEQYGNPITPGSLSPSASFYALVGGISHLQQAIYNRQGSSFWAKLGYNQYFLTWQPKSKQVSIDQIEKLYFLVQSEMTAIKLRVSYFFTDATSQLNVPVFTVEVPPAKSVIEFIVSPDILKNSCSKPTLIASYQVWIEYQSSAISEIRTFILDAIYYENLRYFLFLNSLGGYDTLRTTGDGTDDLDYERTSISKVLGPDFTEMDHQVATGFVSEVKTYKANTGWMTRDQIAWLRDFLLSKQVYQIVRRKLVPVVITTTQAQQRVDREDLYSIEFEYRRAFSSEYYSREITTAAFTDDFNDDFANE